MSLLRFVAVEVGAGAGAGAGVWAGACVVAALADGGLAPAFFMLLTAAVLETAEPVLAAAPASSEAPLEAVRAATGLGVIPGIRTEGIFHIGL